MSATREQHMEALARANEVRRNRAALKCRIKAGEADIVALLSEPLADWMESMRLGELLEAAPFVGPSKTYRYLAEIGNLSYVRRLDRLTTRQKFGLAALLTAKEKELERQRSSKRVRAERGVR